MELLLLHRTCSAPHPAAAPSLELYLTNEHYTPYSGWTQRGTTDGTLKARDCFEENTCCTDRDQLAYTLLFNVEEVQSFILFYFTSFYFCSCIFYLFLIP
jgi:hypothetical protein